ncbi:VanZ like family protein [Paenibacillus sp. UNC496MF]|uniref:VanZ family protein n=1 Tax=Paenibacillus sp. UNC496MF TaxID=1502753 RepID=UPI0008EF6FA3|nr:VanZ family protein [Paenibacillus sp. UNC496MF]SFI88739.1 VanZ like family protein [Paenibacillus sp. UNC496MF]
MSAAAWVRIARLALLGWVALIFVFSSQTYQEQSIQPKLHHSLSESRAKALLPDMTFRYHDAEYVAHQDPYGVLEFLFRKGAHLFVYAVLACLGAVAFRAGRRLSRRWPIPLLLVLLVASLDEINQRRIPGRTSNPEDVLVDLAGAAAGLLLWLIWLLVSRLRHKRFSPVIK